MLEIGDPTGVIITILLGVGVPLLLFSMKGYGKTAEGTITGSLKIEGLKTNVVEVKEEMQKGFDRMEIILSKRDDEMKASFHEANKRIEELSSKVILNEYRIRSLERSRIKSAGINERDNNNNE